MVEQNSYGFEKTSYGFYAPKKIPMVFYSYGFEIPNFTLIWTVVFPTKCSQQDSQRQMCRWCGGDLEDQDMTDADQQIIIKYFT